MYNKRLIIFAIVCILLIGDSVVKASKLKSQLKGYNHRKHSVTYRHPHMEKEYNTHYYEMRPHRSYKKENHHYRKSKKSESDSDPSSDPSSSKTKSKKTKKSTAPVASTVTAPVASTVTAPVASTVAAPVTATVAAPVASTN